MTHNGSYDVDFAWQEEVYASETNDELDYGAEQDDDFLCKEDGDASETDDELDDEDAQDDDGDDWSDNAEKPKEDFNRMALPGSPLALLECSDEPEDTADDDPQSGGPSLEELREQITQSVLHHMVQPREGRIVAGLEMCRYRATLSPNGHFTHKDTRTYRDWYTNKLKLSRHQANRYTRGVKRFAEIINGNYQHPLFHDLVNIGVGSLDVLKTLGPDACDVRDDRVVLVGASLGIPDTPVVDFNLDQLKELRRKQEENVVLPDEVLSNLSRGELEAERNDVTVQRLRTDFAEGEGLVLADNMEVDSDTFRPVDPSHDGLAMVRCGTRTIVFCYDSRERRITSLKVAKRKWKEENSDQS